MTRTLSAFAALLAASATFLAPSAPAARADGGTYSQLTSISFSDTRDAPAGRDLLRGSVRLDPNLPRLEVDAGFRGAATRSTFLVLRLGDLVSGTCQFRLEAVSNRRGGVPVLRQPGEVTHPPSAATGSAYEDYTVEGDARLENLVPTCAVMDVVGVDGTVLDTVVGGVKNSSATRAFLRVAFDGDTVMNVDSGEEFTVAYRVATAGGVVYDATIDAISSDAGLTVEPGHRDLGDVGREWGPTYSLEKLRLTATPGLHTLTLRLAGGNAATSQVTLKVWARGGALAGDDSLAGQTFFTEQYDSGLSDGQWREWSAHAFLDDTWARLTYRNTDGHAPPSYRPCTQVTLICQHYAYDAESGLVQIGTDLGELRDGTLTFDAAHYRGARAATPGGTVAFEGNNLFDPDKDTRVPRAYFGLKLRKDGTFTRVTRLRETGVDATQRGRYRIGQGGVLVARTEGGTVIRTGLAFVLDEQGQPRPQQLGVYAFDVWFHPRKG